MPNAPEIKERMRVRRRNLVASRWQKRVDGKWSCGFYRRWKRAFAQITESPAENRNLKNGAVGSCWFKGATKRAMILKIGQEKLAAVHRVGLVLFGAAVVA
jgi:hypothetical protein